MADEVQGVGDRGVHESAFGTLTASKHGERDVLLRRVSLVGASTDTRDRIERAATWASSVLDEAMVEVLESEREGDELAIFSRYVPGASLAAVLKEVWQRELTIPLRVALRMTADLLEALDVVHRLPDLDQDELRFGGVCPDSIWVGEDGRTRLLEPGIAAVASCVRPFSDDVHRVRYRAPEAVARDAPATVAGDIFSVGALLWELLAGHSLFGRDELAETLVRVLGDEIPRLESVPEEVADVLAQALDREPENRFSSAAEMLLAVDDLGAGDPSDVSAVLARLLGAEPADEPAGDAGGQATREDMVRADVPRRRVVSDPDEDDDLEPATDSATDVKEPPPEVMAFRQRLRQQQEREDQARQEAEKEADHAPKLGRQGKPRAATGPPRPRISGRPLPKPASMAPPRPKSRAPTPEPQVEEQATGGAKSVEVSDAPTRRADLGSLQEVLVDAAASLEEGPEASRSSVISWSPPAQGDEGTSGADALSWSVPPPVEASSSADDSEEAPQRASAISSTPPATRGGPLDDAAEADDRASSPRSDPTALFSRPTSRTAPAEPPPERPSRPSDPTALLPMAAPAPAPVSSPELPVSAPVAPVTAMLPPSLNPALSPQGPSPAHNVPPGSGSLEESAPTPFVPSPAAGPAPATGAGPTDRAAPLAQPAPAYASASALARPAPASPRPGRRLAVIAVVLGVTLGLVAFAAVSITKWRASPTPETERRAAEASALPRAETSEPAPAPSAVASSAEAPSTSAAPSALPTSLPSASATAEPSAAPSAEPPPPSASIEPSAAPTVTPPPAPPPAADGFDVTKLFGAVALPSDLAHTAGVPQGGGVRLGLPRGWTEQVKHNTTLLLVSPNQEAVVAAVARDLRSGRPTVLNGTYLAQPARMLSRQNTSWGQTKSGASQRGWSVLVTAAHTSRHETVAVLLDVPERGGVLVVGTWPAHKPALGEDFVTIVAGAQP